MCFVWISEQTAIISLYSINWLVFKTEAESVYCAVRTGSLNNTAMVSYLQFFRHIAGHSIPKSHNLFIMLRLGEQNLNTLKKYQASCFIFFLAFQKAEQKTEISSMKHNNKNRLRFQVRCVHPCHYTAITISRDGDWFTFPQTLNISISTEY